MAQQFEKLVFGVPKEIMVGERRVAATPETVKKFTAGGATVLVEKGAGSGIFASDDEYVEAGAKIVEDVEEIFKEAQIILKVKEPLFNKEKGKDEVDMMHKGQVIVTFLHPAAPTNHGMVKKLVDKGITALTLDGIPRITRAQAMDALTSMSSVAGYKSVLMAANELPKFIPMTGTAVGVLQPASVFVMGVGVAGLQAIATAKRLGAVVHAADIRPEAAEHAKSLGAKIVETGVPAEAAIAEGGYAKHLSAEWLEKEREAIFDMVANADIVICTALVPGKTAPVLVTEEMVKKMKAGSVIIDVAIDQGGNCELTVGAETVERYGVLINGTKNIPGMVPTSSTSMFASNIYNYVAAFIKDGKVELNLDDEIIKSSLVSKDGELLHVGAKEAMGIK